MGENMNQPEGGRLYIEGQPVEWNGNLPELEPLEELEPLPTVPESTELTLTLTPEATEALERLAQAAREVCKRILEAFRELVKALSKIWDSIRDNYMEYMLCVTNSNPKWWHLYKHAKKRRTRKKYWNRLMRQLLSIQKAASAQEA